MPNTALLTWCYNPALAGLSMVQQYTWYVTLPALKQVAMHDPLLSPDLLSGVVVVAVMAMHFCWCSHAAML